MLAGLNRVWKDLKRFTFDSHNPLSSEKENTANIPNSALTLNVHEPKTSVQDSLLNYQHVFVQQYENVITGRPKSASHYFPGQTVYAQEDNIKDSWNGLVMDGPCSYSNMGKPFDNVLFKYHMNTQQAIKKLKHDNWDLKMEHVGTIGVDQCCVKNNIVGKSKAYDNFNPYFKVGEENNFGVISVINENIMNDSGLSLNLNLGNRAINSLYTGFKSKYKAVYLDAKVKFSQHYYPKKIGFDGELSGVFGHSFENFGLLAGFSLAKSNIDESEWKDICQAVSLSIVLKSSILRITLHPNISLCTVCTYLKINNELEIATCSKVDWRNPELLRENNVIGIKFRYSDKMAFGLHTNLVGNIKSGCWYNVEALKVGLFTSFYIKNQFEDIGRNIGISIEF